MGIDVSLTHTAMWFGDECVSVRGEKLRGAERLHTMYLDILRALTQHKPRVAIIEGYAYAANSRAHRLGEIGGVVRLACATAGVEEIYEVPPSSLKKWWAGHGRASKADMMAEACERTGQHITNDDVADACALWHAGSDKGFLRSKGAHETL